MAKILNYYALCPINDVDEFLGLSQDAESGTIINSLGRNIISSVKLSNQKQVNSWTSLDKFTNKVIYDFKSKQYVGVFGNRWIRCWSQNCTDINKVKKIKLAKPIQELIPFERRDTIVLYNDGTCESLELAIDTRKMERNDTSLCYKAVVDSTANKILKSTYFQTPNGKLFLAYFSKPASNEEIYLIRLRIEPESLQILEPVTKFKIARDDKSSQLKGYAVVDGLMGANLITIWSDRRIFHLSLRDDYNVTENAPGQFSSMMNAISVQQPLSIIGINKDCIAIYGANPSPQDGGSLILYNTQFNVVESKQYFKIYFNNSRLWIEDKYIFLASGQTLAVVQFRISKEQLSDMVGSQRREQRVPIDTECINVEGDLEDKLQFDSEPYNYAEHTIEAVDKEHTLQNGTRAHDNASSEATPNRPNRFMYNEDTFDIELRSIYQHDIDVEILRDSTLPADMLQLNLTSNIRDLPFNTETVHMLSSELERNGFSEISITEYIIPLLIKADRSDELVICLRKYTNVSEKWLVEAIKYFVDKQSANNVTTANVAMDTNLNAALSCSFNEDHIREHIRATLNFDHVIYLLNYIYEALKAHEVQLEERPQHGDYFNDDQTLLKWFNTIIDAHLHQFIISRNIELKNSLLKWKELIDGFVIDLQGLKTVEALLINLVDGKSIRDKHGSKWYSIEEIQLY